SHPSGPKRRIRFDDSRACPVAQRAASVPPPGSRSKHDSRSHVCRGAPLNRYVIPFERLAMRDVETVGGKNASLGEMIGSLASLGVRVPGGFATTAQAYRDFLKQG